MNRDNLDPATDELEKAAAEWVFRREAGLTTEEETEFGRWRAADPRHESALMRHKQAWSILDRPRQAGQAGLLLERIARRAAGRRRVGATGVVLILLLAAGASWQLRRPADAKILATSGAIVRPETRTLADGSVVELRHGAEIAVDFSGPVRGVLLKQGEAHFQVAKSQRPFVVTAGTVEFRAVGTAFAVQIANTQVELLVTEGRVAVEKIAERKPVGHPSAAAVPFTPPPPVTVDAGNRMLVELQPTAPIALPVVVPLAELAERLAWRAPKLEFTETPLAEAVALMNRHNRMQFVVEEAELARQPVSGLFRADRADAFLRILEVNFNVTAEEYGGVIRLRRGR